MHQVSSLGLRAGQQGGSEGGWGAEERKIKSEEEQVMQALSHLCSRGFSIIFNESLSPCVKIKQ